MLHKVAFAKVIFRAQVNNILVKGTSKSYVSAIFQPQSVDCCGNPVQAGLCNVDAIAQGCNTGVNASATKGILPGPPILSEVCYKPYAIGNLQISAISKFEILGVAKGISFGNITSRARTFSVNQTRDVLDYGSGGGQLFPLVGQGPQNRHAFNNPTLEVGCFVLVNSNLLFKCIDLGGISLTRPQLGVNCSGDKTGWQSNLNCLATKARNRYGQIVTSQMSGPKDRFCICDARTHY
ncbi:unnamed protein product, partial [marine sediment metagenome]